MVDHFSASLGEQLGSDELFVLTNERNRALPDNSASQASSGAARGRDDPRHPEGSGLFG